MNIRQVRVTKKILIEVMLTKNGASLTYSLWGTHAYDRDLIRPNEDGGWDITDKGRKWLDEHQ